MPADTSKIDMNSVPHNSIHGLNGFQNNKYFGPCPPQGTHKYFFELYVLDTLVNLGKNNKKSDLESDMSGYILDQATLIGLYSG